MKKEVRNVRTMSAQQAWASFADLLGSVYYTKEAVVVEKKGKPVAVVISPEAYERVKQQEAREEAEDWAVIERIGERNRDTDPDEVLADATAAVEEVRREMYEEQQRAAKDRR